MNNKTVKKFRGITRKSSIYMIFDGANTLQNKLQERLKNENLKTFSNKKINELSSLSSSSNSDKSKESKSKDFSEKENSSTHNELYNINRIFKKNIRYKENKLPVITNSEELIKEMNNMNLKDKYYKKFVSENNFGAKYCIHNPAYEDFSKLNKEENLIKLGLNSEEKNPLDLIDKKGKKNYSNINMNKYDNFNYLLFRTKKYKKNPKPKSFLKLIKNKQDTLKFTPYKTLKTTSLIKKNEFSNFLIMEFIKKNFPSIIINKDVIDSDKINKTENNIKEKRLLLKFVGKNIEARKIFAIKDSTVINNPRNIPGFLVEIPTISGMKLLKKHQKANLMKNFLEFISVKFRSQLNFIFDINGNLIHDFGQLPDKEKYIFVSSLNIFQGISFSMHKGIIDLYLKHFGKKIKDDYFFNESSLDESTINFQNTTNNNNMNNFEENDDVYELFFSKNINNKNIKYFKKKKYTKNKEKSFTFGIDDNDQDNYKYIYYSDNEQKREKLFNNISKKCKNRIDFYLEIKNSIYDKKLKDLELKLLDNKHLKNKNKKNNRNNRKPKTFLLKQEENLRKEYLSHKKIKIKNQNILNDDEDNRPLKCQDIIDTFNLLKSYDTSMNINKFYKRKKSFKECPFIEKNIKANIDKYFYNRKKTNSEYPSLINYNIPKIIKEHPKYTLNDLIKYYTKFKSLINLWFNMHSNVNNTQFGIDFETFYNCTEELCKEEKDLAKRIYEKINNSPSGFLSLEDFIESLNSLNQKDLVRQFYFFLRVFGKIGKKILTYDEVLHISLISIKRLAKNQNTKEDEKIIKDLSYFFANYIFKICDANINDGIEIENLRNMLNSQGEKLEYLKLFLLFDDDKHKNEIIKTLNEFKKNNIIK